MKKRKMSLTLWLEPKTLLLSSQAMSSLKVTWQIFFQYESTRITQTPAITNLLTYYRKSGYFCVNLFLRILVKSLYIYFCVFYFCESIHMRQNKSIIIICVYHVQIFLNINVSYVPIYSLKTHAGKLFPLLSTCSMQTFTYFVQTKSNLGRTMFAMISVYINNVLVISCLSPKPSVMHLYLHNYTH